MPQQSRSRAVALALRGKRKPNVPPSPLSDLCRCNIYSLASPQRPRILELPFHQWLRNPEPLLFFTAPTWLAPVFLFGRFVSFGRLLCYLVNCLKFELPLAFPEVLVYVCVFFSLFCRRVFTHGALGAVVYTRTHCPSAIVRMCFGG